MIYTPVPTIFCLHACIRPSELAAAGGAQRALRAGLGGLEKIPIFASKGSKGESYGLFTL